MTIRATGISFDEQQKIMWLDLSDGRNVGVSLSAFPRLENAGLGQLKQCVISDDGASIHWDALGEDLWIDTLVADAA